MSPPNLPDGLVPQVSPLESMPETVVVSLRGGEGNVPVSLLADLDSGRRTVSVVDRGALDLFRELEHSIRRNGVQVGADSPTAGTLAGLVEAARVLPRADSWPGESRPDGDRFRLPKPADKLAIPLGDVLRARRSTRSFSTLDTAQLSTLLYHSARVRETWVGPGGFPCSSRSTPSAGARHPVDLVIIPGKMTGPGATDLARDSPFIYDPMTCELVRLSGPSAEAFRDGLDHVSQMLGGTPSVLLAMVARLERTFSRYRGGLSLVYRDAGALLATIGLVASAIGLRGCPLARGTAFNEDLETLPGWVDVGGVALGGKGRPIA
jgi:SagB-type dehydrogenase family enzyme